MATVAAIVDGTGSVGAALGPELTGFASNTFGWGAVFYMIYLALFSAGALIIGPAIQEWRENRTQREASARARHGEVEGESLLGT